MLRALTPPAAHQIKQWLAQTWFTLAIAVLAAGFLQVGAHAAARADFVSARMNRPMPLELTPPPAPKVLVWQGADIDGDGAPDFANPTGKAPRTHDAYGLGAFGASRDGGSRKHEGVDFVAEAGQPVASPISGYVTKIGMAYADDRDLQFVEITNRAIGYVARVFYVNPAVEVGEAVRLGQTIGEAHGLQERYPGGMTDHVHLELMGPDQKRMDATAVLTEKYVTRLAG
jgi:Membrane proteins related to metalloendopeptidases